MKVIKASFIATLTIQLFIVLAVFSMGACQKPTGAEFVGKWVNIKEPTDIVEIQRSGDKFVFVTNQKYDATYKGGVLDLGFAKIAYDKSTDTIILGDHLHFKRLK